MSCAIAVWPPFLPIAEMAELISQSRTIGQRSTVRLFRQRIREILAQQNQG